MKTLEFYSGGELKWSITKKDFPPGFIDAMIEGCERFGDFRLIIYNKEGRKDGMAYNQKRIK
jgi:hypothetical protein